MRLAILSDVALRHIALNNTNSPALSRRSPHKGGFSTTTWNAPRAFSTHPNNPQCGTASAAGTAGSLSAAGT
jgi:hypothetical protein